MKYNCILKFRKILFDIYLFFSFRYTMITMGYKKDIISKEEQHFVCLRSLAFYVVVNYPLFNSRLWLRNHSTANDTRVTKRHTSEQKYHESRITIWKHLNVFY